MTKKKCDKCGNLIKMIYTRINEKNKRIWKKMNSIYFCMNCSCYIIQKPNSQERFKINFL